LSVSGPSSSTGSSSSSSTSSSNSSDIASLLQDISLHDSIPLSWSAHNGISFVSNMNLYHSSAQPPLPGYWIISLTLTRLLKVCMTSHPSHWFEHCLYLFVPFTPKTNQTK
jgi:hypothetical protein